MPERISKTFTKSEWIIIRENLHNKGKIYKDWEDAIKLLSERVYDRYFLPTEIMIDYEKSYLGAGFSIATIECSLIEFIAALTEGRLFKKDKLQTDKQYYYDDSSDLYRRFLRNSEIFKQYFSSINQHSPLFRPDDFYKNVRCALIHEAQTKNDWEIRIFGKNKSSDRKNKIIFSIDPKGKKIVYRTALFYQLREYFDNFCKVRLIENSDRGRTLRKLLARKIDYILEVPPDKKYWWTS